VHELGLWLRDEPLPPGHPFREIHAHPQGPTTPEIWILGSSDYGAQLAAHFGLPYAYAYFFSEGRGTEEALALYRRNYRPSIRHPRPLATICVWALAADTEAEARQLLQTREHWRVGFERGLRTPLLSPQDAAAHPYTEADLSIIQRLRERAIVGTAQQVAAMLEAIAAKFGLDEIVINTWTYDPAARQRSYELIAQATLQG
jgi:luciferase family oxidoreductase group 1